MKRVLPRDAFNDGNLLKCIGQLTLLIEDGKIDGLTYEYDGEPFDIRMDESDGSTYVANLTFMTETGWTIPHRRNLNSRHRFPIIFVIDGEDYYPLNENGKFQMDTSHFKKKQS